MTSSINCGERLCPFRSILRREAENSAERPVRFYTIARGSALECAAVLDALEAMAVFDEPDLRQARELLERIVSMLTGLIRP